MLTYRLHELISTGDGLAIVEQSQAFGAGCLINFGINSNTSAKGFLKCTYRVSCPFQFIHCQARYLGCTTRYRLKIIYNAINYLEERTVNINLVSCNIECGEDAKQQFFE